MILWLVLQQQKSPWNHSNLHLFKSSQRSCAVLTRVQLSALSPAETNQTWRANSSDVIWTASVNIERNQDTHEEIERSCFPTASLKQGSLSSCQLLPICSLQQLLDKSKCFAFKTWQERNEYLRDYHSSNIHTIALFLSSYVNSHWSIFGDTFFIILSVWENNAIFN